MGIETDIELIRVRAQTPGDSMIKSRDSIPMNTAVMTSTVGPYRSSLVTVNCTLWVYVSLKGYLKIAWRFTGDCLMIIFWDALCIPFSEMVFFHAVQSFDVHPCRIRVFPLLWHQKKMSRKHTSLHIPWCTYIVGWPLVMKNRLRNGKSPWIMVGRYR